MPKIIVGKLRQTFPLEVRNDIRIRKILITTLDTNQENIIYFRDNYVSLTEDLLFGQILQISYNEVKLFKDYPIKNGTNIRHLKYC